MARDAKSLLRVVGEMLRKYYKSSPFKSLCKVHGKTKFLFCFHKHPKCAFAERHRNHDLQAATGCGPGGVRSYGDAAGGGLRAAYMSSHPSEADRY